MRKTHAPDTVRQPLPPEKPRRRRLGRKLADSLEVVPQKPALESFPVEELGYAAFFVERMGRK